MGLNMKVFVQEPGARSGIGVNQWKDSVSEGSNVGQNILYLGLHFERELVERAVTHFRVLLWTDDKHRFNRNGSQTNRIELDRYFGEEGYHDFFRESLSCEGNVF